MKAILVSILFSLLAAASGLAQTNTAPATGSSTNQLRVALWLPRAGGPVHVPAMIRLFARVLPERPAQKGDAARVDFFADAKLLGSTEVFWHEGLRPDEHSKRPQPMIVSRPGFSMASMIWSNVPAGTFALTARASMNGMTAVSPPADVTVQP